MNRSWIASAYGYLVCLVAVITFLISASRFVDSAFDLADPIRGRGGYYGPMGGSLSSFEAFRTTYMEQRPIRTATGETTLKSDSLTTEQLRARYEVLRADRIAQSRYTAMQGLVKHGLLILAAAVLFMTHWRWVRGLRETP
jgi:hypothetical protein